LSTPPCGNEILESGEECERHSDGQFGPCCDPTTCKLRRDTYNCRPSADICTKDAYCSLSTDQCPDSLPEPANKLCTDFNACTFEDHCDGDIGKCLSGTPVCFAQVTLRTTSSKGTALGTPQATLTCNGLPLANGEASCEAEAGVVAFAGAAGAHLDSFRPTSVVSNARHKPASTSRCKPDASGNVEVTKPRHKRIDRTGTAVVPLQFTPCGKQLWKHLPTQEIQLPAAITGVQNDGGPDHQPIRKIPIQCVIDLAGNGTLPAKCRTGTEH
jgi:hypothetical protein